MDSWHFYKTSGVKTISRALCYHEAQPAKRSDEPDDLISYKRMETNITLWEQRELHRKQTTPCVLFLIVDVHIDMDYSQP